MEDGKTPARRRKDSRTNEKQGTQIAVCENHKKKPILVYSKVKLEKRLQTLCSLVEIIP